MFKNSLGSIINKKNKGLLSIIFCDIDGTLIPQLFSKDNTHPKEIDSLKLSPKIVKTLNNFLKIGYLIFITGRTIEWKDITVNMLSVFNDKPNIIYSNYGDYTDKKYFNFKLEKIKKYSQKFDVIIIIDDRIDLLKFLKKNFHFPNELKIIIYIHARYNLNLKYIDCMEIL